VFLWVQDDHIYVSWALSFVRESKTQLNCAGNRIDDLLLMIQSVENINSV
jgi:hypothetical protein